MTPPGHLLSGYLVGSWIARGGAGKQAWPWVMGAALLGSIAPDFDVAFGLMGGWAGASLHRGALHSFLYAAAVGALTALAARSSRKAVFTACFGGGVLHVLSDALNFWGVQAFWPWPHYFRLNLIHERDWIVLGIVLLASVAVWRRRSRAAAVWLAAVLPAYVGVQVWWRDEARRLAISELPGRRLAAYPTGRLNCGWLVVSAGASDLTAHCVVNPLTPHLSWMRTVPVHDDFLTRASAQSPGVREFLAKSPFPFSEELSLDSGAKLIIWRDLREAYDPRRYSTSLQVRVDPSGAILWERHDWSLSFW